MGGEVGESAVEQAQQLVSDAYRTALANKVVAADKQFATDMVRSVINVTDLPRIGNELSDNVRVILEPYMTGAQLTGDAMQQISRELQGLKAAYKNDALYSRIGKAVDSVEESVFGLFRRQSPEVLPAYNRAKAAARRLYILEDAVLKAKNQEGVFTPAQLGQADRTGMSKYGGKRGAAAGKSPFHDFQRNAQKVLPSKIPDSGTPARLEALLVPGMVGAAGGGASYASGGDAATSAGAGLSLASALTLAYSRAGQRALAAAAAKRTGGMKAVGDRIKGAARRVGTITGGAVPAILPSFEK